MKIETKTNIGDTMYVVHKDSNTGRKVAFYEVKKIKVAEINIIVDEENNVEELIGEAYFRQYQIQGEYKNAFMKETDAIVYMNKENKKLKDEIEDDEKWRKSYEEKKLQKELKTLQNKAKKLKIKLK